MFAQVSCANKFISAIGAGIERGVHYDKEQEPREAEDGHINMQSIRVH